MTDRPIPAIDLGAEAGIAAHEYVLIGVAVAIAAGFLGRGLIRRRRGAARGCSACPGCSGGASCPIVELPDPGGKP
ncbi:hypothetical protein Ga0609869_000106 [Rhodovulum iodosum]|uniref:FeoB-associated Cys-rich membrane protein n=1 Tax=Rhodovulum iodosum TaxID=68291 RepID=A0ABV3XN70_9RHOB|nr:FeoB-associated Cys-rich membrane protein [Rhodovulum robiginosum]RSK35888.1 FeoB-associated Cys-rich membrane protein [Rhodovulum robiginosum]